MGVSEVRLMHWAYYIAGGIYTSEEFSSRFKRYWFALNLGIACLAATLAIGYCATVTSFDSLEGAIVLSLSISTTSFPIISLINWYCRRDLKKLLHFIEHKSDAANRCNKSFFRSRALIWNVLVFISGLGMLMIPAVDFLLMPGTNTWTRRERFHVIAVPFMDRFSQPLYWAIYFVEFSLQGLVIFISFAEPLLILTMAFQLNDIVLGYCRRLNALDKADASFDIKLVSLIREYRVLMSSIQLVRPNIQIFSSLFVPIIFYILANQIFVYLETTSTTFLQVRLLMVANLCALFLYPYCKFGTMIYEMKEEIVRNVYGLPWNDQPPRRRKTFYIFLNQVQRPLTFYAFRVILIDVTLLPRMLRVTYSMANVLSVRHR